MGRLFPVLAGEKLPLRPSISITDEEMLDGFGYSKAHWAAVRRLLKKDGYLISRRSGGDTVYSINEKHFSEALKAHSQTRKAEQLQQYPSDSD